MNLVTVLLIVFLAVGFILGQATAFLVRWIKRLGAVGFLELGSMDWEFTWVKPKLKEGIQGIETEDDFIPLVNDWLRTNRGNAKRLVVHDTTRRTPVWLQSDGVMVAPDTSFLKELGRSLMARKMNEEEGGFPIATVAIAALIGIVIIIAGLGYLIAKLGPILGAMGNG